jgi:hypothetical protein
MEVIEREKYKAPFPIQMQAIPVIMSGRDCIGCAKTVSPLSFFLLSLSLSFSLSISLSGDLRMTHEQVTRWQLPLPPVAWSIGLF